MAYSLLPIAGIDLVNLAEVNLNSAGTAIPTRAIRTRNIWFRRIPLCFR